MRVAIAIAVELVGGEARAGKHPRFEPTDLELENPGITEIDLQLGPMRGPDAWRVVVPDFEIDLGVTENVELGLDGAYAVEGRRPGPTFFDHSAPENLWPSVKVELGDWKDREGGAWAFGVQAGPKLPLANGASGLGVEGLVLFGRKAGGWHAIVNGGALVDPRASGGGRPSGVEGGLDLQIDLVPDRWAVLGELGGIYFVSADDHQLAATAGIQYSVTEQLDLSLVALVGLLPGSDPYGLLFGVSPKLALW